MSTDNELTATETIADQETGLVAQPSLLDDIRPDLPDFMTAEDVKDSTEGIAEYVRPPFIRVVQPLSKGLIDDFNPGDTVLMPQRMIVAPVFQNEQGRPLREQSNSGDKWHFVPLFRYTEWISWNPRELTDEESIVYRTIDRNDPLVDKCRDSTRWRELHERKAKDGTDLYIRHCEHLNFIVMPIDTDIKGTPVCLSYSRAEHKVGASLLSLIQMRHAPIYGCVFEASVGFRQNNKGEWYGIDARNPSLEVGGLVQNPADYRTFKAMNAEFKSAHAKGQIQVDLEDDGETRTPSDAPADF